MSDLSFIENYKEIRKRLNGGGQRPTVIPKQEAIVARKVEETEDTVKFDRPPEDTVKFDRPPENITRLKILKDPAIRDYLRKVTILEEGISYRQALLKGAEDVPKRVKLLILPILEDSNFSWEELFGKDPVTSRNARTTESVKIKWDIFRELRTSLNMSSNQIAALCKMDHTSVAYGLGTLRKRKNK